MIAEWMSGFIKVDAMDRWKLSSKEVEIRIDTQ
jgi:hypothetical protein